MAWGRVRGKGSATSAVISPIKSSTEIALWSPTRRAAAAL